MRWTEPLARIHPPRPINAIVGQRPKARRMRRGLRGRRSGIGYVLEAAAAIAFVYFLLGGSHWSAALWAAFAVLAVWIVVMNVRRDAGLVTGATYSRWKLQLGFLMVAAALAGAFWQGSLWLLGLAAILGWFWIDDLRSYRARN